MISWIKKYWISLLFSLLILIACFINPKPLPPSPMSNFDKVVHFFMFLVLGGSIYFENTNHFKVAVRFRRIAWGTLFFPVLYGGLVELIQNYVSPYRTGDWGDFLWDSIGAFIAFAVALSINRYYFVSLRSF
jgi:VanZ like family.